MTQALLLQGFEWEQGVRSPGYVPIQVTSLSLNPKLVVVSQGWFNSYGCCYETWVFSDFQGITNLQTHQRTKPQSERVHRHLVRNMIQALRGWSRYPYYWRVKKVLQERFHQVCRVLVRSRMNSCLVEFPDGHKVVTSRNYVRRRKCEKKP